MDDRDTLTVAVLGAGLMGAAIGAEYAAAGHRLRITTSQRTAPAEAIARVTRLAPGAEGHVEWCSSSAEAASGADVVVESLAEDLELKRHELEEVQAVAPEAVLCSNTSSLQIGDVAATVPDPSRVLGTHYLNPPAVFPVVELVAGPKTDPGVFSWVDQLLVGLGKIPIKVQKDVPGFVINRLQFSFLRECLALVDDQVVSAEDLDLVVSKGLARRWSVAGPFTIVELGGPELFHRVAAQVFPHLSDASQPPSEVSRRSFGASELDDERARVRAALVERSVADDGPGAAGASSGSVGRG